MRLALLPVWIAAIAVCGSAQTAPNGALRPTRLTVLVSARTLNRVNPSDARAALKVWVDTIARDRGFQLDAHIEVANSLAEMRQTLLKGGADVILQSASEYLELENTRRMVPTFGMVNGPQGNVLYSYLLLGGPSSTYSSVAELKGKNILSSSRGGSGTAQAWLEVLVREGKLGAPSNYFGSLKEANKAQACVLPVFFGSADACVVDEFSFNTVKELNPQLGRLKVIGRSGPLLDSLLAMSVDPHPYREDIVAALLDLHRNPKYKQLLMVFNCDRIVALRPKDLDSTRQLWRDYGRGAAATQLSVGARNSDKEKP